MKPQVDPAQTDLWHRIPADATPTPAVKWAGGKTRLLRELLARLPARWGRYFEPFAGGAALFFRRYARLCVTCWVRSERVAAEDAARPAPAVSGARGARR